MTCSKMPSWEIGNLADTVACQVRRLRMAASLPPDATAIKEWVSNHAKSRSILAKVVD